jgi:hypothetical protein
MKIMNNQIICSTCGTAYAAGSARKFVLPVLTNGNGATGWAAMDRKKQNSIRNTV